MLLCSVGGGMATVVGRGMAAVPVISAPTFVVCVPVFSAPMQLFADCAPVVPSRESMVTDLSYSGMRSLRTAGKMTNAAPGKGAASVSDLL